MATDRIIIIGFGGHGKSVLDSIERSGQYEIAGYVDAEKKDSKYAYLGNDDALPELYDSGIPYAALGAGCVTDCTLRDRLIHSAKEAGFAFPMIIDPDVSIARDVSIGEGTFVGKRAVVNAGSVVGEYCIINTGAIIEHDNRIADFSHISVGAILCGDVSVGEHTLIGAGATVIQGRRIGNHCIIGAGSLVLRDLADGEKVTGVVK